MFLIAGPDTLESMQLSLDVAGMLKEHTRRLGMPYIFKGSFDKANRSSGASYRGPGMEEGLHILAAVKQQIGIPVVTDSPATSNRRVMKAAVLPGQRQEKKDQENADPILPKSGVIITRTTETSPG